MAAPQGLMARSPLIIDAHTHIFPEAIRKDRLKFCKHDVGFQALYQDPKSRLAGFEDLLSSMDQNQIQQSVICGFPWKDPGLCREGNEYLRRAQHQYPGRFIAFGSLPLSSGRNAERELHRCLGLGFQGIGELAFYPQGFSERDMKKLSGLLEPLAHLDIPLLIHVSEPVGHAYAGKTPADLRWIYPLILQLPNHRIILAHWGGGFFFFELMPEVAKAARNVIYDTAASPYLYHWQIYSLARRIVGADRILFGSDYPLLSPRRYFAEWQQCRLPGKARASIQGGNAGRLFFSKTKAGVAFPPCPKGNQSHD